VSMWGIVMRKTSHVGTREEVWLHNVKWISMRILVLVHGTTIMDGSTLDLLRNSVLDKSLREKMIRV
jgi:hypothetical protein